MPYIGNTPADKFLTLAKQSFSTSATTSYTLDSSISATQDIALFINNVRQSPVDAYTVSGTALTLTSATAGTDEMYCVYLGKTVGTVNPPNDSVGLDQLSATGTPSSSNYLRGDNSWQTVSSFNPDGAVVFNESGAAVDFRIEADDTTHMFFVDGSEDKIGINQSSPQATLQIRNGGADYGGTISSDASNLCLENSGNAGMTIASGTSHTGSIYFGDSGSADIGQLQYNHNGNYMMFRTNNGERMRITSDGDIGVGNTDPGTARFNVQKNSDQLYYGKNDTSGQFQVTSAGVISATNTTVQSISDERLKKDIADFSGGLNIVKAMKPRTYKWKNPQYHNDKDDTQYGFVAQELLTISNAEKLNLVVVDDANTMMYENEKDLLPDGKANISGYQERDAIYVSAIKELLTKIETLETKVTALENK